MRCERKNNITETTTNQHLRNVGARSQVTSSHPSVIQQNKIHRQHAVTVLSTSHQLTTQFCPQAYEMRVMLSQARQFCSGGRGVAKFLCMADKMEKKCLFVLNEKKRN